MRWSSAFISTVEELLHGTAGPYVSGRIHPNRNRLDRKPAMMQVNGFISTPLQPDQAFLVL